MPNTIYDLITQGGQDRANAVRAKAEMWSNVMQNIAGQMAGGYEGLRKSRQDKNAAGASLVNQMAQDLQRFDAARMAAAAPSPYARNQADAMAAGAAPSPYGMSDREAAMGAARAGMSDREAAMMAARAGRGGGGFGSGIYNL